MSLYKRGGIYWSRIVRHGERLDRSTKRRNRTDAQSVEAKWLVELNDNSVDTVLTLRNNRRANRERMRPVSLTQFSERFFAYLKDNVAGPRTVEFYKQAYKPLEFGPLFGAPKLSEITPSLIQEWTQWRLTQVSATRVNASLRTLRRALRMAEEWKYIDRAPKIKLLPGERQREFVVKEELLRKMLAHEKCSDFLKVFLPFLIDTGLRISEALALTWDHVGLEPKQDASLGWVYVAKGKSKKAKRHVPLTERAHGILRELKEETKSDYVFPAADDKQLSRHWPSEQFRILRDEMNLPDDCVIHSMRHTFCTRLGESNCDAFTIMNLAGHSSITISQRYVHPTPERMENAISRMSAGANNQ